MDEDAKRKARDEFAKSVGEMIKIGVKGMSKIGDDVNVILCSRVEDYNLDDNVIFRLDGNKSYPTDHRCLKCKHKVVLSNAMKKMVDEAKKGKVKFLCSRCLREVMRTKPETFFESLKG